MKEKMLWVYLMTALLVGLYSGAYITYRVAAFKEAVPIYVAILSAVIAGYVAWLTYSQQVEARRQCKWEHFKPLLTTVLRGSRMLKREYNILRVNHNKGVWERLYPKIEKTEDELKNVIVELRDVWGEGLPADYFEVLENYEEEESQAGEGCVSSDKEYSDACYAEEMFRIYHNLFIETKEAACKLAGMTVD